MSYSTTCLPKFQARNPLKILVEFVKEWMWRVHEYSQLIFFLNVHHRSWCYLGILPKEQKFYTKILKYLTWLIKTMVNRGKIGWLRKISDPQIPIFDPLTSFNCATSKMTASKIYLFIFNLKHVVEKLVIPGALVEITFLDRFLFFLFQ